jgi:hypothetical protein
LSKAETSSFEKAIFSEVPVTRTERPSTTAETEINVRNATASSSISAGFIAFTTGIATSMDWGSSGGSWAQSGLNAPPRITTNDRSFDMLNIRLKTAQGYPQFNTNTRSDESLALNEISG